MSTERVGGGSMSHIYAGIWAEGVSDPKKARRRLDAQDTVSRLSWLGGIGLTIIAVVSGGINAVKMGINTDEHHGSYRAAVKELGRSAHLITDPNYHLELTTADGTVEVLTGEDPSAPIKVLKKVKGVGSGEANAVLASTKVALKKAETDGSRLTLVTQAARRLDQMDKNADAIRQSGIDEGLQGFKESGVGLLAGVGLWVAGSMGLNNSARKRNALRRRSR